MKAKLRLQQMADETESYVEMRSTLVESTEVYAQVDKNTGSGPAPAAPNVIALPPKLPPQHAALPLGKFQTMRKLHSTGSIQDHRGEIPPPSPLAMRGDASLHLEPDVEVSLQDLVAKHHKMLPLRVRVCKKKTQEPSNQASLAVGAFYNFHFVVHKKMATFTSTTTAEKFSLPVSSKVNCALVYNPEGDLNMAMTGYTFQDVSDLVNSQPMPAVVCATQLGASSRIESAFMPGEVLVLKDVQETEDRVCISAYSFRTESTKVLEYGCNGYFTTQPSEVQMKLQTLIADVNPKLPCQVQLFGADLAEFNVPAHAGGALLFLDVVESPVLIATSPQNPNKVLEIFITPNIEVKFVEVGGKDLLEMKSETGLLEAKYGLLKKGRSASGGNLGNVRTPFSSHPSKEDFPSQTPSGGSIVYDLPFNPPDAPAQSAAGLLPPGYRGTLPLCDESSSGSGSGSARTRRNYDPIQPPLSSPMTSKSAAFEMEPRAYEAQSPDNDVWSLRAKYEELKYNCNDLRREIVGAQRDIENLRKEVDMLKFQSGQLESETKRTSQENISLLAALGIKEVTQLLDGLGLSQYKKKFSNERVTGRILVKCNEKMLEKELGVSSKLHRMQLMEFIQGNDCVYTVISRP